MAEYKRAGMPTKIKNVDKKARIFEGYYTAFHNEDSDGDIGVPGMTLESVKAQGPKSAQPRIKFFLNHDVTQPIGKMVDMGEDSYGAWYRAEIGDWTDAENFLKMADFGAITEHSYGLNVVKRLKADTRKMTQVDVWEASPLTHWGANSQTPFISLGKSATKQDQLTYWIKRQETLDSFIRNGTATDDFLQSLSVEVKFLTQQIINLTKDILKADTGRGIAPAETVTATEVLNNLKSLNF